MLKRHAGVRCTADTRCVCVYAAQGARHTPKPLQWATSGGSAASTASSTSSTQLPEQVVQSMATYANLFVESLVKVYMSAEKREAFGAAEVRVCAWVCMPLV